MVHDVATLEAAVDVARAYYFGAPVAIGGWVFPIHRHPEWSVPALEQAVERAQTVTAEEWQGIHAEHRERHGILIGIMHAHSREVPQQEVSACVFTPISHVQDVWRILQLRRDLNIAYVVGNAGHVTREGER